MSRYLRLVKHLSNITIAFYVIRPVECLYRSTIAAWKRFKGEFVGFWTLEGDASDWYKSAWKIFKGDNDD